MTQWRMTGLAYQASVKTELKLAFSVTGLGHLRYCWGCHRASAERCETIVVSTTTASTY
jgi:hypothetical protein